MKKIAVLGAVFLVACSTSTPAPENGVQHSRMSTQSSSVAQEVQSSSERSFSSAEITGEFDPLRDAQGKELPASVALDVPFTPQAPHADWNPPFDEACEEASLLTVEFFLRGTSFTPEIADREIRAMASWEEDHGYAVDITTEELADIAGEYFGRKARAYLDDDVTKENIKSLLAAGYPVIIPAAGRDLGNPYFSGDGPPYHMLVITGYTRWGNFITNDPGTRRGEDYTYDQDLLVSTIHDWNGSTETIRTGRRAMLVVGE